LGWDDSSINIDEVAERLQDIGVTALSIHARTRAPNEQTLIGRICRVKK
jgi:tRNA-dihydrouridine synthase